MPPRPQEILAASWLWLAASTGLVPAGEAATPGAGTMPARSRVTPAPAGDTLLARVGPRRKVTVAEFRRAWDALRPPERPDSLTPQTARQFLDLLVDKEAVADYAVREHWVWTRRESLLADAHRDQLTLRAALDPRLAVARDSLRRAGLLADDNAAGVAARDRFVAGLAPQFDDSLLARLAAAFRAVPRPSADSGLFAQLRVLGTLPRVRREDSLATVAVTRLGPYHVSEFMDWWAHLSPVLRPRVESADQVRDLVSNALFETDLRREAAHTGLERRPDIAAALSRELEGFAVDHYVSREIYQDLPRDSATLRRFFARQPSTWALPQRVRLVRLELANRAEAGRMGARLRDAHEVETLIGEPLPTGPLPNLATPPTTRFVYDIIERDEPKVFRRAIAAGAGAVIGPDSSARGWWVARVVQVIPGRLRTFEEAREFVAHDWEDTEGERRMRALFTRLRTALKVRVNEPALRRMLERRTAAR